MEVSLLNSQQVHMPNRPPNKPSRKISLIRVCGNNTIGNEKKYCSEMIGNYYKRFLIIFIRVRFFRKFFKIFNYCLENINVKNIWVILRCRGDSLEPSAKINILLFELFKRSILHFLVFHKYRVSNLKKSPAIAVWMAVFAKFLVMLYRIKFIEHFGIRPSRLSRGHIIGFTRARPPVLA